MILPAALLCNYGRGFCLIDVGTEGFSEKIDFAVELLPKSVRLGGQNPIIQLHALTSEALHGLSDEESVDVFDRCQLAFEHVIKRLKQDQDEDKSYREELKRLNEKNARKAAESTPTVE